VEWAGGTFDHKGEHSRTTVFGASPVAWRDRHGRAICATFPCLHERCLPPRISVSEVTGSGSSMTRQKGGGFISGVFVFALSGLRLDTHKRHFTLRLYRRLEAMRGCLSDELCFPRSFVRRSIFLRHQQTQRPVRDDEYPTAHRLVLTALFKLSLLFGLEFK
jgi:hypothetical protein